MKLLSESLAMLSTSPISTRKTKPTSIGVDTKVNSLTPFHFDENETDQRTAENGDLLLANMTLSAPDGMLTLMLELFDNLTSAIDCQGDDGSLSLTFNSQEAYDYALQTWSYINAHDDGKFLLITNHAGCGPDENRQSYMFVTESILMEHPGNILTCEKRYVGYGG